MQKQNIDMKQNKQYYHLDLFLFNFVEYSVRAISNNYVKYRNPSVQVLLVVLDRKKVSNKPIFSMISDINQSVLYFP